MKFNALRLSAIAAGSAALISLLPPPSANAAVHRHGPAAVSGHRAEAGSIHVVHRMASTGGSRHLARVGTTYVSHRYPHGWSHGYSYGWRGATVLGTTVVDGGYSPYYSAGAVYGYRHHSCHWYYHNEPYHVPSWCGSYAYGGPSYAYSGPSYADSYGNGGYWHGYRRRYAWSNSRVQVTNRVQVANQVHVNGGARHPIAMHGGKEARLARPGGHPKVH